MTKPTPERQHISDTIYIAKGIAIFLLALSHYHVPESMRAIEPAFWPETSYRLQQFLMPFFAFMAGYVLVFTGQNTVPWQETPAFVAKKFRRLMFPYFSVSLLVVLAKFFAGRIMTMQIPLVKGVFGYIALKPLAEEYSSVLWFLYALFVVFVMVRLLTNIVRDARVLIALSLPFLFIRGPELFGLNAATWLLPYFLFGSMAAGVQYSALMRLKKYFWAVIPALALTLYLDSRVSQDVQIRHVTYFLFSAAGTLAVISGALSTGGRIARSFKFLGVHSMSIYMFHPLVMVPVRVILFRIIGESKTSFLLSMPLVCTAGIVIPILATLYILQPLPLFNTVFLGGSRKKS